MRIETLQLAHRLYMEIQEQENYIQELAAFLNKIPQLEEITSTTVTIHTDKGVTRVSLQTASFLPIIQVTAMTEARQKLQDLQAALSAL